MIRFFLHIGIVSLFVLSCKNDKKTNTTAAEKTNFRLPAEFEEQEAVWLAFPNVEHREGFSNQQVVAEIIQTLLPYVKVNLILPNEDALLLFRPRLADSTWKNPKLKTYFAPYQEFWLRDMGPQILCNTNGEKAMLDLSFNAWGYSDSLIVQKDESLDENIAKQLNINLVSTSMIHEGGDTEVNGKGTLLVVEAVEKQRNPTMTIAQMEAEFQRTMGIKKIIWLKRGVYEDDFSFDSPINVPNGEKAYTVLTTGGHIDEFCRFADANTILLAEVDANEITSDPVAAENQKRIEENYQILKNATDQDGKPFRILRVPMPPTQVATLTPRDGVYDAISTMNFTDKHVFPKGKNIRAVMASSYLNFLISNKIIVAQKYYDGKNGANFQTRDAAAKNALQNAFPNHKIVMLDARAINWGGGGIHCITMQQSK
jgi:agmatine deiminase